MQEESAVREGGTQRGEQEYAGNEAQEWSQKQWWWCGRLSGAYARVDPALAARLGGLDASEEVDRDHVLGARDLPRVAEAQPVVGLLELPAVHDALLEDAVVVAQPIAVRGQAQRGHRVEEARRQTPEAAVAQPRVLLDLLQLLQLEAQLCTHTANNT